MEVVGVRGLQISALFMPIKNKAEAWEFDFRKVLSYRFTCLADHFKTLSDRSHFYSPLDIECLYVS